MGGLRALAATVLVLALLVPATVESVAPPPVPLVKFELAASGFTRPLYVGHAADGSGRLFVIDQPGVIKVVRSGATSTWFDIRTKVGSSGNEQGLLGMAFHPDFAANGFLFVSYTDRAGDTAIERYTVPNPASGSPDPASARRILSVDQPYSNHNGGGIAFGPDGYLYVGLGDGGGAGDPQRNGQNKNVLLGKMLRLDVDVPTGYAVPSTNPFAAGGGRGEIWAYGLRNPWRWSFDRATGDLWIADVGQNLVEEVNLQAASSAGGENYGWSEWEGHYPYRPGAATLAGKTFPVIEYAHSGLVCAVTGGFVYRGSAIPALAGSYVYADYCTGQVWAARGAAAAWVSAQILDASFMISSFGEDERGEIYVADHSGGRVWRIAAM